jgi:hypothetical protein
MYFSSSSWGRAVRRTLHDSGIERFRVRKSILRRIEIRVRACCQPLYLDLSEHHPTFLLRFSGTKVFKFLND